MNTIQDNPLISLFCFNGKLNEANKNSKTHCFNRSFELTPIPCKKQAKACDVISEVSSRVLRVKNAQQNLKISSIYWRGLKENIRKYVESQNPTLIKKSESYVSLMDEIDDCFNKSLITEIIAKPTATLSPHEFKILSQFCWNSAYEIQMLRNMVCSTACSLLEHLLSQKIETYEASVNKYYYTAYGAKIAVDWSKIRDLSEEEVILSLKLEDSLQKAELIPGIFPDLLQYKKNLIKSNHRMIDIWTITSAIFLLDTMQNYFLVQPLGKITCNGFPQSNCITKECSNLLEWRYTYDPTNTEDKHQNLGSQTENVIGYYDTLIQKTKKHLDRLNFSRIQQNYADAYQKLQDYIAIYNKAPSADSTVIFSQLPSHETIFKLSVPIITSKELKEKISDHIIENVERMYNYQGSNFYAFIRSILFAQSNHIEFEKSLGCDEFNEEKQKRLTFNKKKSITSNSATESVVKSEQADIHTEVTYSNNLDCIEKQMSRLETQDNKQDSSKKSIRQLSEELKECDDSKIRSFKAKKLQHYSTNAITKINTLKSEDRQTESLNLIETESANISASTTIFSSVISSKEEVDVPSASQEWEVVVSKKAKNQFSPKSFSEFISKITLDKRVNDFFVCPEKAFENEERFASLPKKVLEKISLFKQYPGVITYYTLTRGIQGKITSKASGKSQSCFFAIGSITPYNDHGTPLITYKGVFTDAFDYAQPTHLYHHSFTEKQYSTVIMEYSDKGYMEEHILSDIVTNFFDTESNPDFTSDCARFKISEIPLGVIIDDTIKRIRYKLCFPIE